MLGRKDRNERGSGYLKCKIDPNQIDDCSCDHFVGLGKPFLDQSFVVVGNTIFSILPNII